MKFQRGRPSKQTQPSTLLSVFVQILLKLDKIHTTDRYLVEYQNQSGVNWFRLQS